MLSKNISAYSGPWKDSQAIANPENEQPASSMNRIGEDCAQMTRTSNKIFVRFATSTAGPGPIDVGDSTSQWGEGNSYAPTIAKTAPGIYTITYAVSYPDALVGTEGNEAVEETEDVSFRFLAGDALDEGGLAYGDVRCTSVDNVITVYIFDPSTNVVSDIVNGTRVQVWGR